VFRRYGPAAPEAAQRTSRQLAPPRIACWTADNPRYV